MSSYRYNNLYSAMVLVAGMQKFNKKFTVRRVNRVWTVKCSNVKTRKTVAV